MDEFVCEKCGCVDLVRLQENPAVYHCTECTTGKWHGLFPKQPYDPLKHLVVNRPSGLGMEG